MIAVGIDNLLNLAFDVRRQAGQYGRSGPALRKRFSVDRAAICPGREDKLAGDFILPVCHDVERRNPAFRQASEHVAFPAHRRHDQGRLEGYLRDSGDRRRAVAILAPRGENVHAVRTPSPFLECHAPSSFPFFEGKLRKPR